MFVLGKWEGGPRGRGKAKPPLPDECWGEGAGGEGNYAAMDCEPNRTVIGSEAGLLPPERVATT